MHFLVKILKCNKRFISGKNNICSPITEETLVLPGNATNNGVAITRKKKMHIKGRLLEQTVILLNCAHLQNGKFSLRKEFSPKWSEFCLLRAVPYGMENHFYHIR